MPMDFTEVEKAGSRLGTGTMIVLDDQTCPVGMTAQPDALFRPGILRLVHAVLERPHWAERILEAWRKDGESRATWRSWSFRRNSGRPGNTFCALAPGAAEPLQSALKYFREDFERHIREQRCPWR